LELPEAGAFWREVLADVSDAVVLQDPAGRVRWHNPAASRLFPATRTEGWAEPGSSDAGPAVELRLETDGAGYVKSGDRRFPSKCRTVRGGWRIWTLSRAEDLPPATGDRIDGFLSEAGARLAGAWDRAHTASLVAELAAGALGDCAIVVLPTTRGRWEWWRHEKKLGAAKGLTRRVPPEAAPVLTRNVVGTGQPGVHSLPPEEVLALPSVLAEPLGPCVHVSAVPLLSQDGVSIGAIVLGCRDERPAFGGENRRALLEFTRRASAALSGAYRFERQREAIEGLQTTLGPSELPELPSARLEVWYEPTHGPLEIGGDFYDVHSREDGSALLVLGDICGNGAEAAALTGRVRHSLAALHLVERDGQRLLNRLNEILIASGSSRFATLVVGSVSATESGGLRLTVASGGHPPPLVLRRSGVVEELVVQGMLVGVSPDARFAECTVELAEGDMCVMYTDGITEARGPHDRSKLYGPERLTAVLAECADLPAHTVLRRVRESVHEWLGGAEHDDMAVLAIQCVPED
jgi:serine phosphatase RsbU (regulator of sigma subunit)